MHGFKHARTWRLRVAASSLVAALALLLPAPALAQPDGPPSALTPASPASSAIADLHNVVLLIAVAVFVVVEGLIVVAAFRFRRKPSDTGEPAQIHGNTRLELAWTIAPALIVVALFVLTLRSQATIDATAFSDDPGVPITVDVIGHQWWWEFRYPDLGILAEGKPIATAGELVIPVGRAIDLRVSSVDVIHSFWVPELNGKTDAIPRVTNKTWMKADRAGAYFGQCAELCGVSHAAMRLVVTAVSEDEFAAWARNQAQDAAEPIDEAAQAGKQVFLTAGCVGCHTIDGVPEAVGRTGPNLTHVSNRPYIAGGILANTPYNQARWLANPPGLKAGSLMPNLNLSQPDIDSLVAYLQTLK